MRKRENLGLAEEERGMARQATRQAGVAKGLCSKGKRRGGRRTEEEEPCVCPGRRQGRRKGGSDASGTAKAEANAIKAALVTR